MGTFTSAPPDFSSPTPQVSNPDDQKRLDILNQNPDDVFEPLLPGLTQELETELTKIVDEFERESYASWRWQFRDVLEAESFWKDIQQGFYDFDLDLFRTPSIKEIAPTGDSGGRFNFVTNIYRALGWTIISVLGQKIPSTVFLPSDYTNENDVVAARTASDVVPVIERNNRLGLLHMKTVYYLFTGGVCVGYVRYVQDGERFGYKDDEVVGMGTFGVCPSCGEYVPVQDAATPQTCPSCGESLDPGSYQTLQMPTVQSTRKTPRGQEVISIHGPLETRLPPWTQEQSELPYIGIVNEIHVSKVKSLYGKRAENITGSFGSSGPYDLWDRYARLVLNEPSVGYYSLANTNLVTVKRYWLRRSSFYLCKDRTKREALLKIFSKGAYVTIAEQTKLLDARDENMDEHLYVTRGMEGHAMFTPALGKSAISLQKRLNTLTNFIMEWVEFSAAGMGTFFNAGTININALRQQRRAPGMMYPVKLPPGTNLASQVYTDKPGQIAGEIFRHVDDLNQFSQMVTGAVPTVSGGTEQSLKPTTYLADREQALGKLFVPWQHLRDFWSVMMFRGVKLFAANRTDDEKYSIPGETSNEQVNKIIRLDNLQGEFDAYPEVNETFPRLWYQQQALVLELLQSQDPVIQGILGSSRNLPYMKAMFGLPSLYVPGEDDHAKQELEIAQLLQQQPIPQMGPMGQVTLIPSVMPDYFADDHVEHMNTVKQWAVSNEGVRAMTENPQGYKNVIAHGVMHQQMIQQQALQQAQLSMAAAPQPQLPTGKGPKSSSQPSDQSRMNEAEAQKSDLEHKVASGSA